MSRTFRRVVWARWGDGVDGAEVLTLPDSRTCGKPRCPVCGKDVKRWERRRDRRGARHEIAKEMEHGPPLEGGSR